VACRGRRRSIDHPVQLTTTHPGSLAAQTPHDGCAQYAS
jgi:hypothetical protein